MFDVPAQLQSLFDEIDNTPWGAARQALVTEALQIAVESGDEQLEYAARMRQTSSANMAGDTDLMISSFAWCLAKHDADPARFPAELGHHDLMWHFKWMAGALLGSPAFSIHQIEAVLDDMEEHYRRADLGLSGVWMARFESSWLRGDMANAEKYRVLLETTPRDEYSHCEACTRSQLAGYAIEVGKPAEGIALVEEMLERGDTCAEEPEHALARVLLPLVHAGRHDEARAAYQRSYRLSKSDPDNLGIVARNLQFVAVTGNESRALAMVERHLPWLAHDGLNADSHQSALGSFALALDAVTAAGHGTATVRGADAKDLVRFFGEHDGPWSAAELAAAAWRAADDLAARFDARNGTSAHSQDLAELRARAHEHYDIPLGTDQFVAVPAPVAPQTPDERFERAVALGSWGDATAARMAAEAALTDGDVPRAPRLRSLVIGSYAATETWDEAAGALRARQDALRAAGRHRLAEFEADLGPGAFGRGSDEDATRLMEWELRADELDADTRAALAWAQAVTASHREQWEQSRAHTMRAIEYARAAGDDDRVPSLELLLASVSARISDTDPVQILTEALDHGPNDGMRARILGLRARILGNAGDFGRAIGDADECCRLAETIGATTGLTDAYALAAMLQHDAGNPGEAAHRFRVAIRHAEREGHPDILTLRYQQGIAQANAGDMSDAADTLADVLADEERAGVTAASRAQTAGSLAQACEADGQVDAAIRAWLVAAALNEEDGVLGAAANARTQAGRILGRYDETDGAVDQLRQAVAIARSLPEDQGLLINALHLLGQALGNMHPSEAFVALDEAQSLAASLEDGAWTAADIMDTRARVLMQADQLDDAVATALTASDAFAAVGDLNSACGSELFAARALAANSRGEDAVPLFHGILERGEDDGLRQVCAIELGNVLTTLGRHSEATEVRKLIDD